MAAGLLLLLAQALKALRLGTAVHAERAPQGACARSRQRWRCADRSCPSWPLRRCDAGRRRPSLPRLSCRCSRALPLARDARPDRQRRSGAARSCCRCCFQAPGLGVRAALALVAAAGVAAAAVILALPRLAASRRVLRFRLGRWLSPRTTSRRAASEAWALVSACWLVRVVAVFLLLGTLGVGFSLPLALALSLRRRRGSALPIGPAGAATQVGASGAALIASGVDASQALGVARLRRSPRGLLGSGDRARRRSVAQPASRWCMRGHNVTRAPKPRSEAP